MTRVAIIGEGDAQQWNDALAKLPPTRILLHTGPRPSYVHGEAWSRYDTIKEMLASEPDTTLNFAHNNIDISERHTMKAHEFLWLDLETTGLDPRAGVVLEFAAVLCEDGEGDDFAIVQSYTGAVHHSQEALASLTIDTRVDEMHARNDLWADVAASTTTTEEVDAFLTALAKSLTPRKRSIVLAGSSVHFDRAWCAVHFPEFAKCLSHRVFDVTTLRRAVEAWAPKQEWIARDRHRALDDVMATIQEARIARHAMGFAQLSTARALLEQLAQAPCCPMCHAGVGHKPECALARFLTTSAP